MLVTPHPFLIRGILVPLFAVVVLGCVPSPPAATITPAHGVDWRDEVIYQVMIDRFADGDPNNNFGVGKPGLGQYQGGDWRGLADRLDYLSALGVTALWISPAVKNVDEDAGFAGYHGYWTQDFMGLNPHFGDKSELRRLVNAAHARGMKVILDIVTNHIGQLFYYDINGNGNPDIWMDGHCSPGPDCTDPMAILRRITEYDPDYDPRMIQGFTSLGEFGPAPIRWQWHPPTNHVPPMPREFQNPEWYNRRGRVTNWAKRDQVEKGDFPGGLKDIRTDLPEVRDKMIEVFAWWQETFDFDGFRVDTVKHVEHVFWRGFLPAMRQNAQRIGKGPFFLFGEVFDGDDRLLGEYTGEGEFDSLFYFSHKFRVFDDIFQCRRAGTAAAKRLYEERATIETYDTDVGTETRPRYRDTPQPDGVGIAPRKLLVHFMDNHDVARFLDGRSCPDNPPDWRHMMTALVYLFTIDGIPCLYYGTEQGFAGGNDPANREPLWRSAEYAARYADKHGLPPDQVSAKPFDTQGRFFRHIAKLSRIRREQSALRRGEMVFRHVSDAPPTAPVATHPDAGILAFERVDGASRVLVVVNAADRPARTQTAAGDAMATGFPPGTVLRDLYDEVPEAATVDAQGRLTLELPAQSWRILSP